MTDVAALPIPLRAPPHLFENKKNIVLENVPDRESQTERTCRTCGLVKITVHGRAGQSWREWRGNGGAQFLSRAAPECRIEGTTQQS